MSKETLFKCPFFKISKEPVIYSNGTKSDYYTVDGDDFVVIIPKLDDSTYIVVSQPRPAISLSSTNLEFPAGALHEKETPLFGALRELQEETGYIAKTITFLGSFKPIISRSNMTGYAFLAIDLIEGSQKLDPTECDLKVLKITVEELANSIKGGKFIDGSSLSAMTIYDNYKKNQP